MEDEIKAVATEEPKLSAVEEAKVFEMFKAIREILDLKTLSGVAVYKLNRKKLLRVIDVLAKYARMLEKNIK